MSARTLAAAVALGLSLTAATAAAPPSDATDGLVVATGIVADEASRAAILARLRELYGNGRVVDRIEVGTVAPPPGWTDKVTRALTPQLAHVRRGQLQVDGSQFALEGTVPSQLARQQVAAEVGAALDGRYTLSNRLAVGGDAQTLLDTTLNGRVVEFEPGSATLTAHGTAVLDEMAVAIRTAAPPSIQVVGHTDSSGERLANIGLSLMRANAVRDYLIGKGIAAASLSALGAGPDRPAASNATAEGRARNRRIEFTILR